VARPCKALKRNGAPCRMQALPDSDSCWAHDERNAEKRRAIASKAGRMKSGGEIADIKAKLREVADDVLEGKTNTARGSVYATLYGVLLRAIEAERKQHEVEELGARLAALERVAEERNTSPSARGGVSRW
jgi:hypothetical protein